MEIPDPSPDLLAEIQGDLHSLRGARAVRMVLLSLGALAFVLGMGLRPDMHRPELGSALQIAVVVGYAVSGLALCALAFGLPVAVSRRLRWALTAAIVAGLALVSASVVEAPGAHPFAKGAACFGTGLGLALGIAVSALAVGHGVLRRHAPTGWLLGAGSGLLGMVTLHLACTSCPTSYAMSWLWHGMVPVAAGLIMAGVWRFLRLGA